MKRIAEFLIPVKMPFSFQCVRAKGSHTESIKKISPASSWHSLQSGSPQSVLTLCPSPCTMKLYERARQKVRSTTQKWDCNDCQGPEKAAGLHSL